MSEAKGLLIIQYLIHDSRIFANSRCCFGEMFYLHIALLLFFYFQLFFSITINESESFINQILVYIVAHHTVCSRIFIIVLYSCIPLLRKHKQLKSDHVVLSWFEMRFFIA